MSYPYLQENDRGGFDLVVMPAVRPAPVVPLGKGEKDWPRARLRVLAGLLPVMVLSHAKWLVRGWD